MDLNLTAASRRALKEALVLAQNHRHHQARPLHLAAMILQLGSTQRKDFKQLPVTYRGTIEQAKQETEHLLQAVRESIRKLLGSGARITRATISLELNRLLDAANGLKWRAAEDSISLSHLIEALLQEESIILVLAMAEINNTYFIVDTFNKISSFEERKLNRQYKHLGDFATDLAETGAGDADPIVGRLEDLEKMFDIMSRKTRNSIVMVGEQGVGKTSLASLLAQQLSSGSTPARFASSPLLSVLSSGQNAECLDRLLQAVKSPKSTSQMVLIFIDDIHHLLGDCKDAIRLLEALASQESARLVTATTLTKYTQLLKDDEALGPRLEPLFLKEPSVQETIGILEAVTPKFEKHYNIYISEEAVRTAAMQAGRQLTSRSLPGSAIELLAAAAASAVRIDMADRMLISDLKLKCSKLEREVAGLGNFKDQTTEIGLEARRTKLISVKNHIKVLESRSHLVNSRRHELVDTRNQLAKLRNKADAATWTKDFSTVKDLDLHVIPNTEKLIQTLEGADARDRKGDVVGPREVEKIVRKRIQEQELEARQAKRASVDVTHKPEVTASHPQQTRVEPLQHPVTQPLADQPRVDPPQRPPERLLSDLTANKTIQQLEAIYESQSVPVALIPNGSVATQTVTVSAEIPKSEKRKSKSFLKISKLTGIRNSMRRKSQYEQIVPQEQESEAAVSQASDNKPKLLKRNTAVPIVKSVGEMKASLKHTSRLSTVLTGLRHGNPEAIQQLASDGYQVGKHGFNSSEALFWASEKGQEAAVKFLILEYGAGMQDTAKMDAIYIAAKAGHTSIIDLLLEKRFVDTTKKYDYSQTDALHEAVKYGTEAAVQQLLRAGADIQIRCKHGRLAFHEAAITGNEPVVLLLLRYGTDINSVDSNGASALHLATSAGHTEIVRMLLERGTSMLCQNMDGATALHLAVHFGHEDIMSLLLERNADVSMRDGQGRTPLHWSMFRGSAYMTTLLLENGANPHFKDKMGRTPLSLAHDRGFDDMFREVR